MRRIPLWLTVVPLVIGGGVYWTIWSGYRDTLRADIAAVIPGVPVTIGGFPYRMQATAGAARIARDGPIRLLLSATGALINRAPWQRDLTIVRTNAPVADVAVPLAGATARLTAATGVSSLHLAKTGIARQSNVFTTAALRTGLIAAPVAATTFEVHLRETRARSNEAWAPTPPEQAQVVLAGLGVRIGGGAPLALAADIGITAAARLSDFAGWAAGGTVEIRALTLSDAGGEVVRLAASAVPVAGRLRFAGTVTTVCPSTVAAAFAGTSPPRELRLRTAVRLLFGGTPGAFTLAAADTTPRPVRAQAAPCPKLRA